MNPALDKLQLYKRLYALNCSVTLVMLNCERLEALGFFQADTLRTYKVMLQHLQAEANGDMVETLHDWELKEAFRLDQMRREIEETMKDPDDVLIEAAERKRQIREQIKELKQRQKGRRRKRLRAKRVRKKR